MEDWETDTEFHKWYASGSWAGRPHTERKIIEVCIIRISAWDDFGTIDEFAAAVQEARDAVPEEYRASSRVFGEPGCYGDEEWRFQAYYSRPMNDEEWLQNMRWSYEQFHEYQKQDRQTYERLKAKYA